jgi:hypothetical protein
VSILRGDFSPAQAAAVDEIAERVGLSFTAVVRMLLDDGLNARNGYRNGSESIPERENHYKERDSWEGEGDSGGCWEGGGDPSNEELPIPVPQSSGRARRRAKISVAEPPAFTEFYDEIYPRKEKRPKALAAWLKAEKEGVLPSLDVLRAVVAQQIDERDWANPEKAQFISHPATWINQRSWNDKPLRGAVLVQPKPDPAAVKAAEVQRLHETRRAAFQQQLIGLTPTSDGWTDPARSPFLPPDSLLEDPKGLADRLAHVEALTHRLTALGAFPLQRPPTAYRAGGEKFEPGLIFPACGGGPWRPTLTSDGWLVGELRDGAVGVFAEGVTAQRLVDEALLDTVPDLPAELIASAEDIRHYLDDFKAGFDRGPVGSEEFAEGVARDRARRPVPDGIVYIGGDPVSREAIERNYGELEPAPMGALSTACWDHGSPRPADFILNSPLGEETGTLHDPGDGSVPAYFPGPGETDALTDEEAEKAQRWLAARDARKQP